MQGLYCQFVFSRAPEEETEHKAPDLTTTTKKIKMFPPRLSLCVFCVFMYVYMCMCYVCMCMFVCVLMHVCARVHACTHVCVSVCVYVCVFEEIAFTLRHWR